ncbi:hypothetical protein I317_04466 [Kwoniella heveanensis CBS 569]|nr:hypothetical protein I317_04466 [Kwoniella heveanensis CBS 569]
MLPSFAGRVGLAGAVPHTHASRNHQKRACNLLAGDLYTYPIGSDTVDATKPVTIKWDTSCPVESKTIDINLFQSTGAIKTWGSKLFADGELTVTFQPKWWNDTETAKLYLTITDSGAPSFENAYTTGPVFTVNYPASAMFSTTTDNGQVKTSTAAAAATQSQDAVFQDVSDTNTSDKSGISKGAIAAAVVVPLLVVALLIGVAVRFWRARENEKRKRWSQALSTHSNLEWEKGAMPGDKPQSILGRPSMGGRPSTMGGRPSMSTYGGSGRPTSSVYAVENNMAGAGAGAGLHFQRPDLASLRTQSAENVNRSSVVMPDGNVRQSRISFAETHRPDRRSRLSLGGDLRPNVQSGVFKLPGASRSTSELDSSSARRSVAYATGSAIEDDDELNLSPSQAQGPHGFDNADVRRAGKGTRTGRRSFMSLGGGERRESVASALSADDFKSAASARGSVDELRDMEAVMLMRRSMISQSSRSPNPAYDQNEVEALDAPPVPAATSSAAPGQSTVAYGPDQMLAVYAARGKVSPAGSPSTPTFGASSSSAAAPASVPQPRPAPSKQNSAMRVLTSLGKKGNDESTPPPSAPAPGDMKSFVHLNNGTVSSAVVDALPAPGPRGVTSPSGERPSTGLTVPGSRGSGVSDGSRYSHAEEDAYEAK